MKKIITLVLVCFLMIKISAEKKPNFLILLGDDISASSIGCFGADNKGVTPHIDHLANEGMVFRNMFVSEAICAPTRAELYTGLQPMNSGCTNNNLSTNKGTKSVVHYMQDLGYRVALTGKQHFGPKSVYPFRIIEGFTKKANERAEYMIEDWLALEDFINEDPDKPFCLFLCSVHAHAPWDAGDSDFMPLSDLILPPHFVDNKVTRHFFREHLAEVKLFDKQVGKADAMLKKLDIYDQTALIVLDENGTGMPCGKWTNYDWGVRSACVIKWPSVVSSSSSTETNAITQYCDILPTLIDAAGGKVPTDMDGKSLLPLLKGETNKHRDDAFFVFAQSRESEYYQSRAVFDGRYKLIWNISYERDFNVGVINGFEREGKMNKMLDRHVHFMYSSWVEKAKLTDEALAKTNRFKKHPEFELYDLDKDPWEQHNLSEEAAMQDLKEDMFQKVKSWMHQQGDPFYPEH